MKKCERNKNHWYSNHLSYCPWCKIANETGKDPFPNSTAPQTPGDQISVILEDEKPPYRDEIKSDLTSQGTNKQEKKPLLTQPKNNPTLYKAIFAGVILCLMVFIGNALINDSQDIPPRVSPATQDLAANNDTISRVETVSVPEQPILPSADFSASTTSGKASLTVTFVDESTGSPTSWDWDFGDGITLSRKNPTHTYSTAGVYTVKETVSNKAGSDTETKTDYIIVRAPKETVIPKPAVTPTKEPQVTPKPAVTPTEEEPQVTPKPAVTPTEEEPQVTPTEEEPQVTPTEEEPQVTPTEEEPQVTPTEEEPQVTPKPAVTPTEEEPQVTPTEEEPQVTPTEEEPQVTPTEEEPQVTPTEEEPQVTPTEEEPQVTPTEEEPQVTPTEEEPQVTPAEEEPQVTPTDRGDESSNNG